MLQPCVSLEYEQTAGAAARRPFVWRDSVYLAHWIYYGRGQERMAISALDEPAGVVRLVHVLSPLPPAVAALKRAPGQAAEAHAESLSAVKGSTWEREKNWGLVEDRGQLVAFHTLLPCTVALTFKMSGDTTAVGGSAHVASRACYAGWAAAAVEATGALPPVLQPDCAAAAFKQANLRG